jgi:hypothetical protein
MLTRGFADKGDDFAVKAVEAVNGGLLPEAGTEK